MKYESEFKLHIPDCKEEVFNMHIKLFQKIDDIYLIAVATSERKSVSFLKKPDIDEQGEIVDFSIEPNLNLFFHLEKENLEGPIVEIFIKEGWLLENYDSTMYYFEHLYVQNVHMKIKYISDNKYKIEINGEAENNHNGGDNINFHLNDIFEADF